MGIGSGNSLGCGVMQGNVLSLRLLYDDFIFLSLSYKKQVV